MKQPLISIIIPVYNAQAYLSEAIDSVRQQTCTNWELLLIDDGSQDRSLAICYTYAQQDERIHVISIPNGGVSHARNVGMTAAQGEWILFIDSDDLIRSNALETLLTYSEGVDVIACGFESYPSGEVHRAVGDVTDYAVFPQTRKLYATANHHFFFFTVWGKLYRRSFLTVSFDESIRHCEDEIFNIYNLPQAKGIRVLPDALYCYRSNQDRSTLSNKMWYDALELRARIYQLVLKAFAYDPAVEEFAARELCMVVLRYVFTVANTHTLSREQKQAVLEAAILSPALEQVRSLPSSPSDALWRALHAGNTRAVYWICRKRYAVKIIKERLCFLKGNKP